MKNVNLDLEMVIAEATQAAKNASAKYFVEEMNSEDSYPCGFAWVNIYKYEGEKIRANSKLGKALASLGVKKSDFEKVFKVWNPSKIPAQNVDVKEAGAEAFADVLTKYGFTAYAGSRLD